MAKKPDDSTEKTKKSPKSAPHESPSIVTPPPAPTPTLASVLSAMRGLLKTGEDGHYLLGGHYNRIVDGDLAKQGGYKTAHEMVNAEFKDEVSQASLTIYGLVAKTFIEDFAKAYGCTKLNELVVYLHTQNLPMPSGDPGNTPVSVPQHDGSVVTKAFKDCSTQDLRSAKGSGPAAAVPQTAQTRAAGFAASLEELLGKKGHVKVTPSMKAGEVVWSVHDVPDGLFDSVMDKLRQH